MSYTSLWFSLVQVKVRVSLSGEDVRLLLSSTDTVLQAQLKLQVTSQFGQKIYINLIWTASLCPDLRMIFLQTESVFIYVLAILKKLIRNWFFCELIQKPVFLPFYKCYSQRVEVFRGFLQKDWFFLKKIDSFKESDRTYSFDIFTLFVLSFFWHFRLFVVSMTRKLSYLFLLRFCIMFHVSFFNSGFIVPPSVFPCYCRKIDS